MFDTQSNSFVYIKSFYTYTVQNTYSNFLILKKSKFACVWFELNANSISNQHKLKTLNALLSEKDLNPITTLGA